MSAHIKTGRWLDEQKFAPLQWAVPGIIPEGYGLLVGPPKLGKSWLVLGILLTVAEGGKALGAIHTKQRPVLYAALEDGDRRMQQRSRHITAGEPLPEQFYYFTEAKDSEEVLETINEWLDQHRGGIVALDTLGRIMPPAKAGQGAYERDYELGASLKRISDSHPGSTLLVVHHSRKAVSGDFMDSTSGTNGLNGAADFTLVLERERGEDSARISLTGRDVKEGVYAATMPGGIWQLEGDSLKEAAARATQITLEAGLGEDQRRILEYVTKHPEGVRAGDVTKAFGWETEKPDVARNYLKRLHDAGRINKLERGLYTPVPSAPSVPSSQGDGTHDALGTPLQVEDPPVPTPTPAPSGMFSVADVKHPPEVYGTHPSFGPVQVGWDWKTNEFYLEPVDRQERLRWQFADFPDLLPDTELPVAGKPSARSKDEKDWQDCHDCFTPKLRTDLIDGLCQKCAGKEVSP